MAMPFQQGENVVEEVRRAVGFVLECNPDLIEGFIVVGFRIDRVVMVKHNSCCAAHAVMAAARAVADNPELNEIAPDFADGHE